MNIGLKVDYKKSKKVEFLCAESEVDEIEELMKYETAGDPMSGLRWTRKTREKISAELSKAGFAVSKTTVGKILKNIKITLKCNSKKISKGGKKLTVKEKEMRNEQFLYIAKIRTGFEKKGLPVISIDTKKKECVGNFKNPGTRLKRLADLVNDHDFCSYGIGKAFPYGLFDDGRLEGFVYLGQSLWDRDKKKFASNETPEFAAENIARWWQDYGMKRYPTADEILLLADAGGSNGYRSRIWKVKLHDLLCCKFRLKITICHYPPGASKWNPIEHRLFSEISKNWAGTPLINYETMLKYIRSTTTKTGLRVKARLVTKKYSSGKGVTNEIFNKINLRPHRILPDWNYTLFS